MPDQTPKSPFALGLGYLQQSILMRAFEPEWCDWPGSSALPIAMALLQVALTKSICCSQLSLSCVRNVVRCAGWALNIVLLLSIHRSLCYHDLAVISLGFAISVVSADSNGYCRQ